MNLAGDARARGLNTTRCLALAVGAILGVAWVCTFSEVVVATGPLILTPHISVSEQYNDNIFFSSSHTPDYVTSITPGLTLQYQQPRMTFSLSGGTSAQVYARQTNQNNWARSQTGILIASYEASPRLSLRLIDTVARVGQTRTGEQPTGSTTTPPATEPPSPDTEVSTLLPRGDVLSNSFFGSADYLLAPRWTGRVGYHNNLSNFTDPGGQNVTHRVLSGLTYGWSPTLSLLGSLAYSRYIVSRATDTETYNPTAGFSYVYDPTLSASAAAGVYVNRPLQAGGNNNISSRTGPTFSLTAEKAFAQATVSFNASQYITTSAGVAGVSLTRTVAVTYTADLAQRLTGIIRTSYNDFDTSQTNFQVIQLLVRLNYSLSEYISTGLSYSFRWRDANQTVPGTITAGSIDGNIIQLYIRGSYPVWHSEL